MPCAGNGRVQMNGLRLSRYFEPQKDDQQDDKDDEEAYPAPEITLAEFKQANGKEDCGHSPSNLANTPSHFAETDPAVTVLWRLMGIPRTLPINRDCTGAEQLC